MRANQALAKLRAGGVLSGPLMVYDSPDMIAQVADMGFDWVWLDWQHGQFTETTLNAALGQLLGAGRVPLVRVRGHEPGVINRVLGKNMGAFGVVVPMVQNAEEARAVVQAAYYPPQGPALRWWRAARHPRWCGRPGRSISRTPTTRSWSS